MLSEDAAIVKTEIIHIRKDLNKILALLYEADNSLVGRVKVNEAKIDNLEETQWQAKTALGGATIALIGFLVNLAVSLVVKK